MVEHTSPPPFSLDPLIAEARRRSRLRRLLAGSVLVAAVAIAVALGLNFRHARAGATQVGRASLAPFTRYVWGGHGQGFTIKPSGRGRIDERLYRNSPPYLAWYTFKVLSVSGSPASAVARIRVTAAHNWAGWGKDAPIVGKLGYLRIRHGILHDSIVGGQFCDPALNRAGVCGV